MADANKIGKARLIREASVVFGTVAILVFLMGVVMLLASDDEVWRHVLLSSAFVFILCLFLYFANAMPRKK